MGDLLKICAVSLSHEEKYDFRKNWNRNERVDSLPRRVA